MIISHKHKFIFIKPQKTAGTSIELLLSRLCDDQDIITPLGYDPDPLVRQKNKAKAPQNFKRAKVFKTWEIRDVYWLLRKGIYPRANYWEHLDAEKIKEYVGADIWNEYLKISIVRNPYDHAVSWYKWLSHYGFGGVKGNFSGYLKNQYYSMWKFYAINGLYEMDYVIRFENLTADVNDLSKLIELPVGSIIPVTKSKNREDKTYGGFYDKETIEIVRLKNLNIIEQFGYSFEAI